MKSEYGRKLNAVGAAALGKGECDLHEKDVEKTCKCGPLVRLRDDGSALTQKHKKNEKSQWK